ncbi:MAG: chemotaxis protein CheW [Phycisphaerales bacterium]
MAGNNLNAYTQNDASSGEPLRLVSFNVGNEQFAVDILSVQEINRMMELTEVPQSPPGVCGVINLRGQIVPVLDLRTRLGLEKTPYSEASRIIVVEVRSTTVGFIVDEVHEVLKIERSTVEPTPEITTQAQSKYILGVAKLDNSLLMLLDLNELMSVETLNEVRDMRTAA